MELPAEEFIKARKCLPCASGARGRGGGVGGKGEGMPHLSKPTLPLFRHCVGIQSMFSYMECFWSVTAASQCEPVLFAE